ncbi:MAG: hypothetical protein LKE33_07400 [Acidaminococcus sp.]|jgi:hypothetical protein|nr:hypothetical protein [Acidaminococcus sp.]MCI2099834.1 hypothetical protein [Acidaminococcus sp.]MCI2114063.1 hypothetical protein [Acidaminococcus sp.]MCI2115933.1 hypothetical protein [Acidaminococcus sp.]
MKEKKHCWKVCRSTLTALVLLSLVGGGTASASTYSIINGWNATESARDSGDIIIEYGIGDWNKEAPRHELIVGNNQTTSVTVKANGIGNRCAETIDVYGNSITVTGGIYSEAGTISVGDTDYTDSLAITGSAYVQNDETAVNLNTAGTLSIATSDSSSSGLYSSGFSVTGGAAVTGRAGTGIKLTGNESVRNQSGASNGGKIDLYTDSGTLTIENQTISGTTSWGSTEGGTIIIDGKADAAINNVSLYSQGSSVTIAAEATGGTIYLDEAGAAGTSDLTVGSKDVSKMTVDRLYTANDGSHITLKANDITIGSSTDTGSQSNIGGLGQVDIDAGNDVTIYSSLNSISDNSHVTVIP